MFFNKKQFFLKTIIGCLGFAAMSSSHAALVVTPTADAMQLTNTIIGSGITSSAETYTGAAGASGLFTGGLAAGIGIESGILLTTGNASNAVGPNISASTSTSNGLPGDTDLNTLTPDTTFDATVLQFDFLSDGGDLFFDFVFASEEYNEFLFSGVTDAFGFFLNGVNIGLVPGTSTPINIDTVNCGNPFGSADNNCALFNDNSTGAFDLEYDGFTDVFTASATGLSAGTQSIKLVIGDAGDADLDSAVFISARSFSDVDDPVTGVPIPATLPLFVLGLLGLRLRRKS